VVLLEVLGGGQAQHRIAEKFQPFMVARQAGGGVAEGLLQRRQGLGGVARTGVLQRIQPQFSKQGEQLPAALRGHGEG
jgi:hypothetical protein